MSAQPDFQGFLKEIDDHFVHVLGEVLQWKVLETPQYTVGSGNVVLRLRTPEGRFIFRVPRFSQLQLRRNALAYRHFGASGLMPERMYFDEKCQVERHVDGVALSGRVSDAMLVRLAQRLAEIHAIPASGFGVLSHGNTGEHADAAAWFADERWPGLGEREEDAELRPEERAQLQALARQAQTPPAALATAQCRVCHGDLSRGNILVGREQLWFIDWDQIGAYPREQDFVFMVEADLDARQRDLLLSHYPHALDPQLLRWFALRRLVARRSLARREQLALADRHGMI